MEQIDRTNKKRRVMIGSPCMYGEINVWYVNSLSNTIKMSYEKNVEIIPIWLSYDALIQRVRNDTLDIAIQMDVDDLFWIDCDIEWKPEDFYKLLDYNLDIVGGTYRKKGDVEQYVFRPFETFNKTQSGDLIKVRGLGTGFVRMNKKACHYLYDASPKYYDDKDKRQKSMAFNVVMEKHHNANTNRIENVLIGEDLHAFDTLTKGGFDVWLDKTITCNHIGSYKFQGNFDFWLKKEKSQHNMPGKPAVQSDPRMMDMSKISSTLNNLSKLNKQL